MGHSAAVFTQSAELLGIGNANVRSPPLTLPGQADASDAAGAVTAEQHTIEAVLVAVSLGFQRGGKTLVWIFVSWSLPER